MIFKLHTGLLTLFVFAAVPALAQKDQKEQEYLTVKFQKFPIANFPENAAPVSSIRLIQKMADSTDLGYALKGMSGRVIKIKPAKPLTGFFQEHINRMYKSEYKKDAPTMLWLLHDLHMSGKTVGIRYAYTRIIADAYLSDEGGLFAKLFSMDTTLITESTDLFTSDPATAIEDAFRLLTKRSFQSAGDGSFRTVKGITLEQIAQQSGQNISLPVFTDTLYTEGVYANFAEFQQNKPSITSYKKINLEKNKTRLVKAESNSDTGSINAWGVCEKGVIYKFDDGYLVMIEKQANGFVISGYTETMSRINRDFYYKRMSGAPVGGITGALISVEAYKAALNTLMDKVILVKSIPYITDPLQQPIASCIDMKTGEWSF